MIKLALRGEHAQVDVVATRAVYAQIRSSHTPCDCAFCRNFRALGLHAFPADVLEFFEQAGIDPTQPAETYEFHQTRDGYHLYGGEYYFIGCADHTDDAPPLDLAGSFEVGFAAPTPLAQPAFHGRGAVCMAFVCELPWVLGEAAS